MSRRGPFNQVFAALMLIGLLSAFILPQSFTNHARGKIDLLLFPVSYPVRRIAAAFDSRLRPAATAPVDASDRHLLTLNELAEENEALKVDLRNIQAQLEDLKRLNADREALGSMRQLCRPFSVVAVDSGTKQILRLAGSSINGLRTHMPVIYAQGIVGRLDTVGVGGASVQLITDSGFRVNGQFWRYTLNTQTGKREWAMVNAPPFTVSGNGRDAMTIEHFKLSDVKECGVLVGDAVMLADRDWPTAVQGRKLGDVVSITPGPKNLFADIVVRPRVELRKLPEVMVLVKE